MLTKRRKIGSLLPQIEKEDEEEVVKKEKEQDKSKWQVRVARYKPGTSPPPERSADGFINVLIHVNDPLSPYVVKNDQGHLIENIWQSAKLYPSVSAQRIAKHRMRPDDIVWEHVAEQHITNRNPLTLSPLYWVWREKLLNAHYAVRYPNGFQGRHSVIGALWPAREDDKLTPENSTVGPDGKKYILLDYIESRKRIYSTLYLQLCKNDPEMERLRGLLRQGEKIQLWEVDGPMVGWPEQPFRSLTKEQPGLDAHDIDVVRSWLNNTMRPFGHGIVIAAILLHGSSWLE